MMSILCAMTLVAPGALDLSADDLAAHPRPDWARAYMVVNGTWSFDFDPDDVGVREEWHRDHEFSKTIRVPFPWQSTLSGIGDTAYQGAAWYQRDVTVPKAATGQRVFLVFGAVDWSATVWVNGALVTEHEGGYVPFDVELTDLVAPGQTARITVRAYDVTDRETPTGKQTGWYTPSGGIWQTVYLEFRGPSYLQQAHVSPDIDAEEATFACVVAAAAPGDYTLHIEADADDQRLEIRQPITCDEGPNAFEVTLPVPAPKLWSPDSPTLYHTRITLEDDNGPVDTVHTYFGMRKVSRGRYGDAEHEYILLNDKPIYLRGALHQSFNPEGVYTHPDDDYLRNDYAKAKEFGLNFIRIHIKVDEPRALYWADKLGVMLMCDMPNFAHKTARSRTLWEETLRGAVARDFNHPSVIAWCDFNETWGIRDGGYDRETQEWVRDMYRLTKQLDPTRLAEDNSPCRYDHTVTDINSWHFYIEDWRGAAKHVAEVIEKTFPGSNFNYIEGWQQDTAPLMNSEYGGVSAGSGDRDISWVFLHLTNLLRKYEKCVGYVYTELEDIEWEHNGFMNYDRSPKEYHYPAGIALADLQGDEFPVLDCPPYQEVKAGSHVSVPILLSHWSERSGLRLRLSVDGQTVDGVAWDTWIKPVEREIEGVPYRVTAQGAFEIDVPDASGLMNVVAEVLHAGRRIAANYCVLDVRGGAVWSAPDQYAVSFPVDSFSGFTPDQAPLMSPEPSSKVYGHNAYYIEYQLRLPRGLKPKKVAGCRLVAEIGAKAGKERLDWPDRVKPVDYPQTDGKVWPSDVTLSLNGMPFKTVTIGNDFADARGVLSHEARFHHGSSGALVDAPITNEAWAALQEALKGNREVTLRFEVKADAAHCGGLALFGDRMGAWPANPTLVFSLAPGASKPDGEAVVLNAYVDTFQTVIRRGPEGHLWRHTTEAPGDDWYQPDFDDRRWPKKPGGFGTDGTPGARIGTRWDSADIWLRTKVTAPEDIQKKAVVVFLHHDEGAEVYVNGSLLLERKRHVSDYERIVLTKEQKALFRPDAWNYIAVHCHQTAGGQFVDLEMSVAE